MENAKKNHFKKKYTQINEIVIKLVIIEIKWQFKKCDKFVKKKKEIIFYLNKNTDAVN